MIKIIIIVCHPWKRYMYGWIWRTPTVPIVLPAQSLRNTPTILTIASTSASYRFLWRIEDIYQAYGLYNPTLLWRHCYQPDKDLLYMDEERILSQLLWVSLVASAWSHGALIIHHDPSEGPLYIIMENIHWYSGHPYQRPLYGLWRTPIVPTTPQ